MERAGQGLAPHLATGVAGVELGYGLLASVDAQLHDTALGTFAAAWPSDPAAEPRAARLACAGALTLYFSAWSDFVGMRQWLDRQAALPAWAPEHPLDRLRAIAGRLCASRLTDDERFADTPVAALCDEALALIQQHLPQVDFEQALVHTPVLFECFSVLRRTAEVHELEWMFSRDARLAQVPPLWRGRFWDWASAVYFVLDDREAADRCEATAREIAQAHGVEELRFDLCKRPMRHALEDGRLDDAERLLNEMKAAFNPRHLGQAAEYWDMEGRFRLARGEYANALDAYRRALAAAEAGEMPFQRRMVLWSMSSAVHVATDREPEAMEMFERMVAASSGVQREIMSASRAIARAWFARRAGTEHADELLRAAMRELARLNMLRFMRPLPGVVAQLCAAALELDVEPEFARRVIAARSLQRPAVADASWPFRLRIRTLGGFSVEIDGQPMPRQAKPAVKPMALLRLLAAFDGQPVPVARVLASLWPESEGETGRGSFDMALARLKKILGQDDTLRLDNGQLVADRRAVWFDTQYLAELTAEIDGIPADQPAALQRLARALVRTYPGAFLQHEEDEPWLLAARERQQQRFVRAADRLGAKLEAAGLAAEARDLYERAVEVEPLAEGLYRRLMLCYHAQGSAADAIRVYRRCRHMLSVLLGIAPSKETEALLQQIYGSA